MSLRKTGQGSGCQDISDRWPNEIRLKQRLAAHPGPVTWGRLQLHLIEQCLLSSPASHLSQRGLQRHIAPQACEDHALGATPASQAA